MQKFIFFILLFVVMNRAFGQNAAVAMQNQNFIRDTAKVFDEIRRMHQADQQARNIKKKSERMKQMDELALLHTGRLIELLNDYGYPSTYRFKNPSLNNVPVLVLFDHAEMSKRDTLHQLLTKEKELDRISKQDYALIKWHLNGRKGVPDFDSTSGIKIKVSK